MAWWVFARRPITWWIHRIENVALFSCQRTNPIVRPEFQHSLGLRRIVQTLSVFGSHVICWATDECAKINWNAK